MRPFRNLIQLFDLQAEDLQTRRTILRKKEEILLRFELSDAITVDFAGQEFDKNTVIQFFEELLEEQHFYQELEEIKGLSTLLSGVAAPDLNWKGLLDCNEEFRQWLRPYLNYLYYQEGKELLDDLRVLEPVNNKFLVQFDQVRNAFDTDFWSEGARTLDRYWVQKVKDWEDYYLSQQWLRKEMGVKLIELGKVLRVFRARRVSEWTYPYNQGRVAFDTFLTDLLNASIDSVGGEMQRYPRAAIEVLSRIADHLYGHATIVRMGFEEIKVYMDRVKSHKRWQEMRGFAILAVILFVLGLFATENGCGRSSRGPRAPFEVRNHSYDQEKNTLEIDFIWRVYNARETNSAEYIIRKGWPQFSSYFPDTSDFVLNLRAKSRSMGNVDFSRRISWTDSSSTILPTIEDSIFLQQKIKIDYEFKAEEYLKMRSVKIKNSEKKSDDGMPRFSLQPYTFEVSDLDTLNWNNLYPKLGETAEDVKMALLNDYFLLRNIEVDLSDTLRLTIDPGMASHFYNQCKLLTLTWEPGFVRNLILGKLSCEGKMKAIYLLDQESGQIKIMQNRYLKGPGNITSTRIERMIQADSINLE